MDVFREAENELADITEGMEVIDAYHEKIGKVKLIQMPNPRRKASLADFPYQVGTRNMPTVLAYRLMNAGFIGVDTGWLSKDRVVMPHQIDYVSRSNVHLKVADKDLLSI